MCECTEAPITVLSARGRDEDKIKARDAGAYNYLTKPFSAGQLLARTRVALRHFAAAGQGQLINQAVRLNASCGAFSEGG